MARSPLRYVALVLASLLASAACSRDASGPPDDGTATLIIRADLLGTAVASVVVEVAAPDIPTTLVFNVAITNGVALGMITVPAGTNRTVTLRAYDGGGVETHEGSITLNIQPGSNPTISLVLTPLTGDLPITVTLGSVTVAVTPTPDTLARGAVVQLTAAITDWNGDQMTGTVKWASDNPGVAIVDASGLVTGMGVGTTTIAATFRGVAGTATVRVTP